MGHDGGRRASRQVNVHAIFGVRIVGRIVTGAAIHVVVTGATGDEIIARTGLDDVVALPAVYVVVTGGSDKLVVSVRALDGLAAEVDLVE
jgi:hypothetical protein